ncbi:YiiX/YebB-like N1pC/P60 family cysteine hydrolase [Metasolibacillus sp.]|uniref:YiiX/YebB-like N1pC/P60 family cysteine hydrolase n=1 Tax=Metasolibacillus sp. TaxID=2703680 RepID=UPI0025DE478E|nr:YiiX/YebB-like N1pC/P60 family cysteine hydrolase [Metasolibacillus sp.]MCT6926031.1 septation ring formation regulator EzrA [Metasolibacillus sp.]MCT6942266.1 septation ring formation regulator EzrA [Metasolibacillus sp.]
MQFHKKIVSGLFGTMLGVAILGNTVNAEDNYEELFKQDQELIEYLDANTEKMIEEDKHYVEQYLKEKQIDPKGIVTFSTTSNLGSIGDILVDTTVNSGSIAFTGHAAIVAYSDHRKTVESFAKSFSPIDKDGVQFYNNTWKNKSKAYLLGVKNAKATQYGTAAKYAEQQIGKPYNWVFTNKSTTNSFYCSQLVWKSWLDAGINVETGSVPNAVISPADLVNSSNTFLISRNP